MAYALVGDFVLLVVIAVATTFLFGTLIAVLVIWLPIVLLSAIAATKTFRTQPPIAERRSY